MNRDPLKKKVVTISWWRNRIIELVVAMAAVWLLTSFFEAKEEQSRKSVPVEQFFEVREVFVPDHRQGSNPLMIYDRVILWAFRGFWIAEAQRVTADGFQNACTGSGQNVYDPGETLPVEGVRWNWFFDRPCAIPPGNYRILLSVDVAVPGFPMKHVRVTSNVFEVTP